jgi:hypothetical protein
MNFLVIRGELPFDEVVGMETAETAEQALEQAINRNKNNPDVFMRHPVIEPLEGGSSLFYN